MKALKKLNPYFLKHKWLLITGGVFVIISVVFKLFPALLIRNSFDTIARVIEDYKSGAVRDETVRWELIRYGLYIIASAVLIERPELIMSAWSSVQHRIRPF